MFVFADEFLANFLSWRTLWIAGRLGGGKTLLALALADYLVQRKFASGVIANFPHDLPAHPWRQIHPDDGLPRGVRGAAIIFDEAWQLLDRRSFMSNDRSYGAFARKLETYWIFPSVIPIDARLSMLSVRRQARFETPLGALWVYRWLLETGDPTDRAGGRFGLWRPERYFGRYDTKYIPVDDGDVKLLWAATLNLVAPESAERIDTVIAPSAAAQLALNLGE